MENANQDDMNVVHGAGEINPFWHAVEVQDARIEGVCTRVETLGIQSEEHTEILTDLRRLVEDLRRDLDNGLRGKQKVQDRMGDVEHGLDARGGAGGSGRFGDRNLRVPVNHVAMNPRVVVGGGGGLVEPIAKHEEIARISPFE